ncbi:Hypothetical predicted protein, partial [Pelobates cultripes]
NSLGEGGPPPAAQGVFRAPTRRSGGVGAGGRTVFFLFFFTVLENRGRVTQSGYIPKIKQDLRSSGSTHLLCLKTRPNRGAPSHTASIRVQTARYPTRWHTTKGTQGTPLTGPLDWYLRTPGRKPRAPPGPKMADDQEPSLADIRADIRALTGTMVTKADLQALSATLHEVIRSEVATIQRDLTAQDGRLRHLEATHLTTTSRLDATDAAVTRQGNMLLQLRRQTEYLDNRGRRRRNSYPNRSIQG